MSSVAEKLATKKPKETAQKQVRLRLVYVDFWSIAKLAFLLSVAAAIVLLVATALVWVVLNQTGIFETMHEFLRGLLNSEQFDMISSISFGTVMLFATFVALLNIVVGTALGAIIAILYNVAAKITGGIRLGFTNN